MLFFSFLSDKPAERSEIAILDAEASRSVSTSRVIVSRTHRETKMHARELLGKGFYAGAGAVLLTQEKLLELADDLVKRGKARHGKVEARVDRWVKRGEEEHEALRKRVKGEIEHTLDATNLATKEDISALSDKIETLAERLGQ
jgi:polyhydroxyalkanoate synthesis regulator phasin